MVLLIYNFSSTHVHTCGAMQYFAWKILFLFIKIEIYMWQNVGISPRGIVYMMRNLDIEVSYTIHENDYWHDK